MMNSKEAMAYRGQAITADSHQRVFYVQPTTYYMLYCIILYIFSRANGLLQNCLQNSDLKSWH